MEEAGNGSQGWTGREQLKEAGVGNGQLSSETNPGWHLQHSGAGGCKGQAEGRLSRPCTPSWEMGTVFCRQDGIRWATENVVGGEGQALGSVIRRVIVDVCPLMLASGRSASHTPHSLLKAVLLGFAYHSCFRDSAVAQRRVRPYPRSPGQRRWSWPADPGGALVPPCPSPAPL